MVADGEQWERLHAAIVLDEIDEKARSVVKQMHDGFEPQPRYFAKDYAKGKYTVRVINRTLNHLEQREQSSSQSRRAFSTRVIAMHRPNICRFFVMAIVLSVGCGTNDKSENTSPLPKPSVERKVSTSSGPTSSGSEIPTAELTISDDVMPKISAPTVGGKVMKVIDGDSILVMNQYRKSITVQLRGVDAPELAQKFGETSRSQLNERIEGEMVTLILDAPDEFGRHTAEVLLADESINVWLIRTGCGWHNWKFDSDPAKAAAEKAARADRVGLWASDNPLPPWEWKNPPDDGKLYVQGNGNCYHRASCRTLDARRIEIKLEAAIESHEPCRICEPPTE